MSGGILGNGIPQGQGILGGAGTGFFDQLGQAFADNSGLLMGYGAGGFEGAMQGMAQDERTRLIKQKQAEEEQRKVEALKLAQQYKLPAAIASDPDSVFGMVKSIEMQKRTPKEYGIEETYLRNLQQTDPAKFNTLMESKYAPRGTQAPSGYRYKPDGSLEPIPGGPASADKVMNDPLPAEIASKFGLADQYFKRYDGIEKDLQSEDPKVIGVWDNTRAQSGAGPGGAIYRDMKLGSEAMVRMLTGAGRSESEAKEEAAQYLPRIHDDAKTVLDKQKRLRAALRSMQRETLRGRIPQQVLDEKYPEYPVEDYPADEERGGPVSKQASEAVKGRVFKHKSGATVERLD
jgi:hypothetical protein